MTDSPKQLNYASPETLTRLYEEHGFDKVIRSCDQHEIARAEFSPSKKAHPGTVEEYGVAFYDHSGIRAVIFHYKHSDGTTIRSIKRLVTDGADFRLPQPNASS